MLEHQTPFESLPEYRGGDLLDEPTLRVAPAGTGFLLLQSRSESALQEVLLSEIGLELPAPRRASIRGDYTLLWLTPAEWLLEAPTKETHSLHGVLIRRLTTSLAVVTDMSDNYACCEVSGAHAARVLMSGCSLSLNTLASPVGWAARTALADIPAILWSLEKPQRFRCLVDRSFAGHLRDWVFDAARGQKHHLSP